MRLAPPGEPVATQSEAVTEALRTALSLPVHWSEVDHPAVLRLALDAGITTYDAAYLFLARALGVPLVTFDQRLARAAGDVVE